MSDLALARNCCLAGMLPGEAELVNRSARGGKSVNALNGPTDWILRYIKTTFTTFTWLVIAQPLHTHTSV